MGHSYGNISLNEYEQMLGQKGPTSSTEPSPQPRRPRGRRLVHAALICGGLVLSFVAGINLDTRGKRFEDRETGPNVAALANWPDDYGEQKYAVSGAAQDARVLADFLSQVVMERPTNKIIRDSAIVGLRNIARKCVNNLRACRDADHPLALEMLETLRAELDKDK